MYTSAEQIETLAQAFNNRTLPKEQWTHHAHLTVGTWYRWRHPLAEAINLVRINIREYNVSVGTANTTTSGYHETLTIFWMMVIDFCVRKNNSGTLLQTCNMLIANPLSAGTLVFEFYERDTILSPQARAGFVAPDKQVLNDEVLKGIIS